MKPLKRNQIVSLAVVAVLGLAVVGVLAWPRRAAHQTAATSPSPTTIKGNSTHDEPSPSPVSSNGPAVSPSGTPVPIAKPTLQKSSGNAPGSSVPAGALVEFTCEGRAGLGCELILTSSAGQVVNLGKKSIADNGRGQMFALWDWPAVSGTWSVVARASNSSGSTAASDAQALVVK